MPLLPLDALHALAEQLDQDDLDQALLLLKLFIILCRWFLPAVLPGWPEARMGGPGSEGDLSISMTSPFLHPPPQLRLLIILTPLQATAMVRLAPVSSVL